MATVSKHVRRSRYKFTPMQQETIDYLLRMNAQAVMEYGPDSDVAMFYGMLAAKALDFKGRSKPVGESRRKEAAKQKESKSDAATST